MKQYRTIEQMGLDAHIITLLLFKVGTYVRLILRPNRRYHECQGFERQSLEYNMFCC